MTCIKGVHFGADLRSLVTQHEAAELEGPLATEAPGHLFYIKSLMGPLSLFLSLSPDTQHAESVMVKYAQKVRCAHTHRQIHSNEWLFIR